MDQLTFTHPKVIYYGPHPCPNCAVMITKMGREFGGNSFNYPDDGPIYPNTVWHPHVCDPQYVATMPRAERYPSPPDEAPATS